MACALRIKMLREKTNVGRKGGIGKNKNFPTVNWKGFTILSQSKKRKKK